MHLSKLHLTLSASAIVAMAALLVATTAFADSHYSNDDTSGRSIEVNLTGSQEVPSVSTDTTGRYRLDFNDGGANMLSRLDVYDGDEITAAHLHCARPGENGPAVVTLFSDPNGTDIDNQLDSSSIGSGDIADVNCASEIGFDIDDVEDLVRAINDGDIYVNVHSASHPNGLIRGNLPAGDNSNNDHGYDGHGWKDDDHDGKSDWYKDNDGSWKDSCRDWDDRNGDGKHDRSGKDWDNWNREFGKKDGYKDKDRDYSHQDWNDNRNDRHDRKVKKHDRNENDHGRYGKDGHDGKDGRDWNRSGNRHSTHSGGAHASASVFNLVNAHSRISIR